MNKLFPEFAARHNLTAKVEFVPWSRSRSATKNPQFKDYNLNWKITFFHGDREIETIDYSAGMGHCPSYKANAFKTIDYADSIKRECETGKRARGFGGSGDAILPDMNGVMYSIVMDSEVLDYGSFEDWCDNLGYDSDSRKAESIYLACMKIALKFRAAFGEAFFTDLRTTYQDF